MHMKEGIDRYWGYFALIAVVAIVLLAAISAKTSTEQTITPNDRFFNVSIGPSPNLSADSFYLLVDGNVTTPLNLTLNDVTSLPAVNEIATVRCVEGPSGTANWTGVRLSEILNRTGLNSTARDVVFHCADGYSTSLTVNDSLRSDVILAYGMNGEDLPRDQGYPLRLVVPNEQGYKWAKWIEHIEVVDYDHLGYWESRGWRDDARITTISDWWIHVALLSIAGVLGAFSAISGIDQKRKRWKLSPQFHRNASYAFVIAMIPVFIYWAIATGFLRGSIFYTLHGQLGLASAIILVIGASTGVFVRGRQIGRVHLALNLIAYGLLLLTMMLGISLAI